MSNETKAPRPLQPYPLKSGEPKPALVERKAFSVERNEGGWSFVTVTYAGEKIASVVKSQPNLKPIAIEAFKIAALKYWTSQ